MRVSKPDLVEEWWHTIGALPVMEISPPLWCKWIIASLLFALPLGLSLGMITFINYTAQWRTFRSCASPVTKKKL